MGLTASGFANFGGHFGFPSHGSVRTRGPCGSVRMNVAWPSQVIDKAAEDTVGLAYNIHYVLPTTFQQKIASEPAGYTLAV